MTFYLQLMTSTGQMDRQIYVVQYVIRSPTGGRGPLRKLSKMLAYMKQLNVVWSACIKETVERPTIHTKLSTYNTFINVMCNTSINYILQKIMQNTKTNKKKCTHYISMTLHIGHRTVLHQIYYIYRPERHSDSVNLYQCHWLVIQYLDFPQWSSQMQHMTISSGISHSS